MKNKFLSIIFIIFGVLIFFMFKFFSTINFQSKTIDIKSEEKFIKKMYEVSPDLFEFNEENIAIIYLRTFTDGYTNKNGETIYVSVKFDKNLNECDGYYIVYKRDENNIDVDSTHLCDMLNY